MKDRKKLEKEYNAKMVEKIVSIIGYDYYKEEDPVDMWMDDDRPSPIRSLPLDCLEFLMDRRMEMDEPPKSIYDFL